MRYRIGVLAVASLALMGGGCEDVGSGGSTAGATTSSSEPYTIVMMAGDGVRSVWHIRDRRAGKTHVMAIYSGSGCWVKIDEFADQARPESNR